MILKRSIIGLLVFSTLIMAGCGSSERSKETKQYIDQIKTTTKPNQKAETVYLANLQSPEVSDLKSIKKRNPFDAEAVASAVSGISKQFGNMKLIGIFHIQKKKWAIIRAGGKIYRVVAGDKIGSTQTVKQVSNTSVTLLREDGDDVQTIILSLEPEQEQQK